MLTTLDAWRRLSDAERLAVAETIAAALGAEWRAVPKLRGAHHLAAVLHVPSNTELVAVPGGAFVAGVRADEVELMKTIEFSEDTATEWVDELAAKAPPTEVSVTPFLCARAPMSARRARELGTDIGWVVGDDDDDESPIRLEEDATEELMEHTSWRLPTRREWEWVAREGGVLPFINGATFEQAEAACAALYNKAFDPERHDAGENGFGIWGLPWGDWIADDDEPRVPVAGRGGAAMLYPWQGDEIIMQMAGAGDDVCAFDEQCVRFVIDLPVH